MADAFPVIVAYDPFLPLYIRILGAVCPVLCSPSSAHIVPLGYVGTSFALRDMPNWSLLRGRCGTNIAAQFLNVRQHAHLVVFDFVHQRVEVFDPMGSPVTDSIRLFYTTKAQSELGAAWVVTFTHDVCRATRFPQRLQIEHARKRCVVFYDGTKRVVSEDRWIDNLCLFWCLYLLVAKSLTPDRSLCAIVTFLQESMMTDVVTFADELSRAAMNITRTSSLLHLPIVWEDFNRLTEADVDARVSSVVDDGVRSRLLGNFATHREEWVD